jgi:uncharacterized protein YbbK (DUF523 family)
MSPGRKGRAVILISTCLVGVETQYDGGSKRMEEMVAMVRSGRAVCLCPEQLGGLTTPREPAEIEPGKTAADVLAGRGRVLSISGKDVTEQYVSGARKVLAFCQDVGVEAAILRATSPACGSEQTCDGTHSGTLRPGRGVAAELLAQHGIAVYNQENYLGHL